MYLYCFFKFKFPQITLSIQLSVCMDTPSPIWSLKYNKTMEILLFFTIIISKFHIWSQKIYVFHEIDHFTGQQNCIILICLYIDNFCPYFRIVKTPITLCLGPLCLNYFLFTLRSSLKWGRVELVQEAPILPWWSWRELQW